MQTLGDRIAVAAQGRGGVTFVTGHGASEQAVRVPWAELHADAIARAGGLAALGAGPGMHVGVLGPTTREHVTLLQAVWLTGATLVVLPLPMRLASIDEFVIQTRRRVHQADLALVLVDPEFLPFLTPEPGDPQVLGYDDVGRAPFEPVAVEPDSLALIQFTSGSTSDPKGVTIPHHTVTANLDAIATAAHMDPADDVLVSWLPLYHDMGLVGFLILPMTTGCELVLGAPQDFLASPLRWLRWLSDHGGTATAGPNFAWVLATRALERLGPDERLDLSRLRIALNGAEPIDAAAVEAFIDAGRPHGLRPGAVFPAFGMAEVTIGATFPTPLAGLSIDHVDAHALETNRRAEPAGADKAARRLVRLGRPLPGLELRIVDETSGEVLEEQVVGELQIRGTSVTPGYYRRDDLAAELFQDGWLRTGDLAYLVDGELVVCGRIKDLIIVGGRNVFPDDIERAVGAVEGVRAGNVMAFGIDGRHGKESIVVVCEVRTDDETLLHKLVAERVRDAVGVPAKDIVFVPPGTLPKTSSGKLQRAACRDRYLAGDLAAG